MTHECEHADCTLPAEPGMRLCQGHRKDLRMELEMGSTPRCSKCGELVPDDHLIALHFHDEGLLRHDCNRAVRQPPETEH